MHGVVGYGAPLQAHSLTFLSHLAVGSHTFTQMFCRRSPSMHLPDQFGGMSGFGDIQTQTGTIIRPHRLQRGGAITRGIGQCVDLTLSKHTEDSRQQCLVFLFRERVLAQSLRMASRSALISPLSRSGPAANTFAKASPRSRPKGDRSGKAVTRSTATSACEGTGPLASAVRTRVSAPSSYASFRARCENCKGW